MEYYFKNFVNRVSKAILKVITMKHYSLALPSIISLGIGLMISLGSQAQATPMAMSVIGPLSGGPIQVIDKLDQSRDQISQRARLDKAALSQDSGLAIDSVNPDSLSTLIDPLAQLPKSLDILDLKGNLVLQEVEISPGVRAVAREWLLLVSLDQWQQVLALHPEFAQYLVNRQTYPELSLQLVKIKVPESIDSLMALRLQLPLDLVPTLDRNHVYQPQAQTQTEPQPKSQLQPQIRAQSQSQAVNTRVANLFALKTLSAECRFPLRIGMIDSSIDSQHKAFKALTERGGKLVQKNFLPESLAYSNAHGTAVAGLLIGEGADLTALLPKAQLFNGAAFYAQNAYQQGATLGHLLAALEWLAKQGVSVLNLSLTGPKNAVLEAALTQLAAKGVIMVAAAGNAGPAAAPLYPAAYKNVIAVTAVDENNHIYRWANQGGYIDFAAIGVKVLTARGDGSFGVETGTSMASPVVAAKAACLIAQDGVVDLKSLKAKLMALTQDLGTPEFDTVFGYGILSRSKAHFE
jgi:minor extracellular protease Epr